MNSNNGLVENYDVLEVIGKGTFGTVSKIRRKSDGRVSFEFSDFSLL